MIEYTCKNCGKVKYARFPSYARDFCSTSCATEYNWKQRKMMEEYDVDIYWERNHGRWVCPYANDVSCTVRNCNRCGWNPEVARERWRSISRRVRCEQNHL